MLHQETTRQHVHSPIVASLLFVRICDDVIHMEISTGCYFFGERPIAHTTEGQL